MTDPQKYIPAFCLFLIVFSGCAAAPKTPARMDFPSPEAALARMADHFPEGVALQALANVRITTRESRFPMKLALLVQKPASLRVEAIPLFGAPAFFLSVRDRKLKVFLADTRAFYIGSATPDNVARYLPLRMDPEDLVAALTGTVPPMRGQRTFLQGRPEGDYYRIDMGEQLKNQTLWLRATDGSLERVEIARDQRVAFRARFDAPLQVEGTALPQLITIDSGDEEGVSISIRYTDIRFLKPAPPAMFDITAPPGIEPVYLD